MSEVEKNSWSSFKTFLGNKQAQNSLNCQETMKSLKALVGSMSIKLNFLLSHLPNFSETLVKSADERGERFHHCLKVMKNGNKLNRM